MLPRIRVCPRAQKNGYYESDRGDYSYVFIGSPRGKPLLHVPYKREIKSGVNGDISNRGQNLIRRVISYGVRRSVNCTRNLQNAYNAVSEVLHRISGYAAEKQGCKRFVKANPQRHKRVSENNNVRKRTRHKIGRKRGADNRHNNQRSAAYGEASQKAQ